MFSNIGAIFVKEHLHNLSKADLYDSELVISSAVALASAILWLSVNTQLSRSAAGDSK